jgi:hypothetical protein
MHISTKKELDRTTEGKPSQIIAVDVVEHITLNCFIAELFSFSFLSFPSITSIKALFMLLTFILDMIFFPGVAVFCGDENDS